MTPPDDDDKCPHTDITPHGLGVCTCACGGTVVLARPEPEDMSILYPGFADAVQAIADNGTTPVDAFQHVGYTRAEFKQEIMVDSGMKRRILQAMATSRMHATAHLYHTKPDVWLIKQARLGDPDPEMLDPGWGDVSRSEAHVITQALPASHDELADRLEGLTDEQFALVKSHQDAIRAIVAGPAVALLTSGED